MLNWLQIFVLTAFIFNTPNTWAAFACEDLVSPTLSDEPAAISQLPTITTLPLDERSKELVGKHDIMKLREHYGLGKDLNFESEFFVDESVVFSHKGESIQGAFVQKILSHVFPQAKFQPFSYPHEKTIKVWIRDRAEFPGRDSLDHSKGGWLPMHLLKPANPVGASISRQEVRELLGFPKSARVIHFYLRQSASLSAEDLSKVLSEFSSPWDIVILSQNMPRGNEAPPGSFEQKFKQVELLSHIGKRKPQKMKTPTLVINDTTGKMPYLHAASDLAIVVGPINFFEPLHVGTRTVVFNNAKINAEYDTATYRQMVEVALATGGALAVGDTEDIAKAGEKLLTQQSPIHSPSHIEFNGDPSAFNALLDQLLKHLQNQGL